MAADRLRTGAIWGALVFLALVILVFAAIRVVTDVPNVASGTVPDDAYSRRYALHPVPAYLHILPGVVYLIGAPFQLNRRFREGHFPLHRRMGRVLLSAGIVTGIFAIAVGSTFPFDGLLEGSAAVVFGVYFVVALSVAFLAIKAGDATKHRRFMIRAFAIGLGVGTIRLWIGLLEGFGVLSFQDSFGVAFWLSFVMHAVAAEAYLAWRPSSQGARDSAAAG